MARTPLRGAAGKNFYKDLGVSENADDAAIKKAYRFLVLKFHPDKVAEDKRADAEEKIRSINGAYEVLSNPTKRETYDLQRCSMDKRKRGEAPSAPRVAPRMAMPKEFMMQPMGHPEHFMRCSGKKMFVHCRGDVTDVSFEAFFRNAKFSLWWLPEVNNMCRIRSHGSKGKGDKKAVGAGVSGGFNLSFATTGVAVEEMGIFSDVSLSIANKGQKNDKVNFVAKESPMYDGAFRFETACRRGSYLAFVPPNTLKVVPFLDDEANRILDFMLVDFATQTKWLDLKDVMFTATGGCAPKDEIKVKQGPKGGGDEYGRYGEEAAKSKGKKLAKVAKEAAELAKKNPGADNPGGVDGVKVGEWLPVERLRQDGKVKEYFKDVLKKEVWEADDFVDFFKGHWTLWEYRESDTSVRLRPPEEKLTHTLLAAKDTRSVSKCLASSGDEVKKISVAAAAQAIVSMADSPALDELQSLANEAEDMGTADDVERSKDKEDLKNAQKILLNAIRHICENSDPVDAEKPTLLTLLDAAEKLLVLGGKRPGYHYMLQRKEGSRLLVAKALRPPEGDAAPFAPSEDELIRLLNLPGAAEHHELLKPHCEAMLSEVCHRVSAKPGYMLSEEDTGELAQTLRDIARSQSDDLVDHAADFVLSKLDSLDADESALALLALAEVVESRNVEIAAALKLRAPALGTKTLASTLLALSQRANLAESNELKMAAKCLASKGPLNKVDTSVLLGLVVVAAKSSSSPVVPVICKVVSAATETLEQWSAPDVVQLLLAVAKAKASLPADARSVLLAKASSLLKFDECDDEDVPKLILATSALVSGSGDNNHIASAVNLLEAAAKQVAQRAPRIGATKELVLATLGLVQGFTSHAPARLTLLQPIFEVWTAKLAKLAVQADSVADVVSPQAYLGKYAALAKEDDESNELTQPAKGNLLSRDELEDAGSLPAELLVKLAQAVASASKAAVAAAVEGGTGVVAAAAAVRDAVAAELLRLARADLLFEAARQMVAEHVAQHACLDQCASLQDLREAVGLTRGRGGGTKRDRSRSRNQGKSKKDKEKIRKLKNKRATLEKEKEEKERINTGFDLGSKKKKKNAWRRAKPLPGVKSVKTKRCHIPVKTNSVKTKRSL